MTDSCRCSDALLAVLVTVLTALFPLQAYSQQDVWSLPRYKEAVTVNSVAFGSALARDTYLSQSRYEGWTVGFENDRWRGYNPDKLFNLGRTHSAILFSPMKNRLGGGSTLQLAGTAYHGWLWHAVENDKCDLLVGPACMMNLGMLYNRQNSNNPVNVEGYVAAGVCVDNTFRYRLFNYPMALQASLYLPLAGVGFAPDYDQPYWMVYRYRDYGKVLHFITPFNNIALTQQVALVIPVRADRFRIGYTLDFNNNRLGGHTTRLFNGTFTIGYAMRFETKEWNR